VDGDDYCISFDNRYKHWWLQETCTELGENTGLAWREGQHDCPDGCSNYQGTVIVVNPLWCGIGHICPVFFLSCPYKKRVILKILKFLGKCIYQLPIVFVWLFRKISISYCFSGFFRHYSKISRRFAHAMPNQYPDLWTVMGMSSNLVDPGSALLEAIPLVSMEHLCDKTKYSTPEPLIVSNNSV
jgi:hypothetical protein